MRRRLAVLSVVLLAPAGALAVPGSAGAATASATSSNWAGYAVTGDGRRYSRVSATWVQPTASCGGARRYSAFWVGLGGYHTSSPALEQIGTAADCGASGGAAYSVWYELVPDVPHTSTLTVRPGDTVSASVTVSGHTVRFFLANRTRGTTFSKTLQAARVDLTSAEWIAEAPSACDGSGRCQTLPLADFGTAAFASATVTSVAGHTGAIVDPAWPTTAITLSARGRDFGPTRFVTDGVSASASVSELSSTGDGFAVTYAGENAP
jgi:Peptidase A4 family